jgi:hypothetical protein
LTADEPRLAARFVDTALRVAHLAALEAPARVNELLEVFLFG